MRNLDYVEGSDEDRRKLYAFAMRVKQALELMPVIPADAGREADTVAFTSDRERSTQIDCACRSDAAELPQRHLARRGPAKPRRRPRTGRRDLPGRLP